MSRNTDRTVTLKVGAMLKAAYPAWQPTRDTANLYAEILAPLPPDAVKQAVLDLIREEREFAPAVGVIYRRALKIALEQAGVEFLTPEEAWGTVSRPNWYAGPPGGLIGEACRIVSWDSICHDPNVAATRAHFFRVFETLQHREIDRVIALLDAGHPLQQLHGRIALPWDARENGGGEEDGED